MQPWLCMVAIRHIAILSLLTAALLVSSCTSLVKPGPEDTRAWWAGEGVAGKPRIVINLSEQRVRYFKGDQLVGVSPISSGRESHATLNGKFHIMEKDLDHRSSIYGAYLDEQGNMVKEDVDSRRDPAPKNARFVGASMRYFMRIFSGIGMHEGYLPGYPASHGCIRLPSKMAAIFFQETPEGTLVEITGAGSLASSEDAIPLGADKPPAPAAPTEKKEGKPEETIRRAIVLEQTKLPQMAKTSQTAKAGESVSTKPAAKKKHRPKPGETVFLD